MEKLDRLSLTEFKMQSSATPVSAITAAHIDALPNVASNIIATFTVRAIAIFVCATARIFLARFKEFSIEETSEFI